MMRFGYTCSSEEFEASELVEFAAAAENEGFEFVTVSDHFHPWIEAQGHSPFAWSTVAAIAARTVSVAIGTGVTCPIIRTHPAIIAQAAATSHELSAGRFFLGVGTGEALNEHVVGERWPHIEQRQQMLVESLEIMRSLWTGATVDFVGQYFTVENARLFSTPLDEIEVVWAASGPRSAALAGEHADGLWCTSPDKDVVDAFREAGGEGRVIGQLTVCWGHDVEAARETAHRQWPTAALGGQLNQDLPTWSHFAAATALASVNDVAEKIICGHDVRTFVDAIRQYESAGVTDLHFHQVGDDQLGFLDWWTSDLHPALSNSSPR